MGVDEAGSDVGAVNVNESDAVFEVFLVEAGFVEDVNDFVVFNQNRAVFHRGIAVNDGGIVQADFGTHLFSLLRIL